MRQAPGEVTAKYPEVEGYLARLRSGMYWAGSDVRDGVVAEMRSHAYEKAEAEGLAGDAVASMEAPESVARRYRGIYGFGDAFSLMLGAGLSLLALLTLTPLPSGAENPVAVLAYPAVLLLIAYLAFAGGRRAGLIMGMCPFIVRWIVLIPGIGWSGDISAFGLAMFAFVGLLFPVVGYAAGEARRRWSEARDA